jgi:cell division protein FtsN
MAKYERGIYEPSDDVFDGAEDEEEEGGSRLSLLIVIGLLVVFAFAGVVWLAYNQGIKQGREDAPRIITAQSGPVRETPTSDVANETPYKGLKIYEQPAPDDESNDEEATPPPTTKPAATPARPPAQTAMTAPAETKPSPSLAQTAKLTPPPALKPATVETKPQAVTEKPAPTVSKPPEDQTVATKPAPVTTEKPADAATGTYVLQIGAYKSEAEAAAAWRAYQAKHPVVAGSASDIMKVDLAGKGTWYRLRIGSFDDKQAAAAMCQKLKADGGDCLTAKR